MSSELYSISLFILKENKKLEKENIELIKNIKHLEVVCQNVEDIEQKNTDLTIENRLVIKNNKLLQISYKSIRILQTF